MMNGAGRVPLISTGAAAATCAGVVRPSTPAVTAAAPTGAEIMAVATSPAGAETSVVAISPAGAETPVVVTSPAAVGISAAAISQADRGVERRKFKLVANSVAVIWLAERPRCRDRAAVDSVADKPLVAAV